MDCPRCQLMLRTTDYEGVEVDLCDNCWGMWLDTGELEEILDVRDMKFSADEKRQFMDLKRGGAEALSKQRDTIKCPSCGDPMDVIEADAGITLVIDRCPDHGIWLDSGEIKAVQAVAEKSDRLHRLLLHKLGLGEG